MPQWKKNFLSLFILYHVFCVVTWILPDGSVLRAMVYGAVEPYIDFAGLWQNWGMFSPDPSNLNLYIYARVWYPGQSTPHYVEMPRMDKLSFISRYELERFRKYIENVHLDTHSQYWPAMAEWLARRDARVTGKTPDRIELWRRWWFVPGWQPGMTQAQATWAQYNFYNTRLAHGRAVDKPRVGG